MWLRGFVALDVEPEDTGSLKGILLQRFVCKKHSPDAVAPRLGWLQAGRTEDCNLKEAFDLSG